MFECLKKIRVLMSPRQGVWYMGSAGVLLSEMYKICDIWWKGLQAWNEERSVYNLAHENICIHHMYQASLFQNMEEWIENSHCWKIKVILVFFSFKTCTVQCPCHLFGVIHLFDYGFLIIQFCYPKVVIYPMQMLDCQFARM